MSETVTGETFWIVDYDLPQGNERRRFYRAIQRYFKDHYIEPGTEWSTQSVVITPDKEFAELVYSEALQLGHAHIYRGELIK